jgi:dihydroxyacetone synthase
MTRTDNSGSKLHLQRANVCGVGQDGDTSLQDYSASMSDDDYAVLSLRNLMFDICNQNGGGHGGSAIGMAAIGIALYKYAMRYNPSNPEWFDRDRFVLSNGEPCPSEGTSHRVVI